jgi:DNA modification methylase
VRGESTRKHPAPFPLEIAQRLIRMYSFVGDMVLDPFAGSGTTMVAAMKSGRNSIGYEIDPSYVDLIKARLQKEMGSLTNNAQLEVIASTAAGKPK